MKQNIILDLDNCISNDEHRIPLINWDSDDMSERWDIYHFMCDQDALVNRQLIPNKNELGLIVSTSRPIKFHEETVAWFNKHGIWVDILLMRNNDDHRSSVEVKKQHLSWLGTLYDIQIRNIAAAYDDKQEVVDMYRAAGITEAYVAKAHNTPYKSFVSKPKAPSILEQAAKTFAERNKLYGDSYKVFGKAAMHMFPNGLQTNTEEEWNRLGVFSMCLSKMTRYAAAMQSGGHQDSAHDLCVYAAMLEELTK